MDSQCNSHIDCDHFLNTCLPLRFIVLCITIFLSIGNIIYGRKWRSFPVWLKGFTDPGFTDIIVMPTLRGHYHLILWFLMTSDKDQVFYKWIQYDLNCKWVYLVIPSKNKNKTHAKIKKKREKTQTNNTHKHQNSEKTRLSAMLRPASLHLLMNVILLLVFGTCLKDMRVEVGEVFTVSVDHDHLHSCWHTLGRWIPPWPSLILWSRDNIMVECEGAVWLIAGLGVIYW